VRAASAAVLLLCALPAVAPAATHCAGAGVRPDSANAAEAAQATLCLVNQIRVSHRLRPLRANPQLTGVATSQVATMVGWDYFADVRPTGQTPMSLIAGSPYRVRGAELSVGQNIAWGSGVLGSPGRIVSAWMASPPHRAIILTAEYLDAGVAVKAALPSVVGAGSRGATYAMEFAVRRY